MVINLKHFNFNTHTSMYIVLFLIICVAISMLTIRLFVTWTSHHICLKMKWG